MTILALFLRHYSTTSFSFCRALFPALCMCLDPDNVGDLWTHLFQQPPFMDASFWIIAHLFAYHRVQDVILEEIMKQNLRVIEVGDEDRGLHMLYRDDWPLLFQ